jgi:hypothetical protein
LTLSIKWNDSDGTEISHYRNSNQINGCKDKI